MKEWYDKNVWLNILWFISGIVWLPIYLVTWAIFKRNAPDEELPKWIRWWGNRVDNLPDQVKEWLHCHRIPWTNYQLNISFLMKNRTTTWDIIRKHGCYPNCDPEDCACQDDGKECTCTDCSCEK
jgi:hypothetical protein